MEIRADIPTELIVPAEAAVKWLNAERGTAFELTGLVDSDAASSALTNGTLELNLILCDGDVCARERVDVTNNSGTYAFSSIAANDHAIPPLLDPPAGVRRGWLDEQLATYDFILLLFYRGRW